MIETADSATARRIFQVIIASVASALAALTIVATQAMTGREGAGSLFVGYGIGWLLLFGAAGALPFLFTASGRKRALRAFTLFGAGGAVGGGLVATLLVTGHLGGSPGAVLVAFAIPFTVPWLVGNVIGMAVPA